MTIAQNFPAISPSLLLDFANVQALDSRITFTRASTATYYGTRTALAEQNLFLQSQTFDNIGWDKLGSLVTANTAVAPDGTSTADLLIGASGSTSALLRQQPTIPTGGTDLLTVYAKYLNYQYVVLNIRTGVSERRCWFDVLNGVVGTNSSGGTASIQNVGNGWYRLVLSRANENNILRANIQLATTDAVLTIAGDGVSGNYIWGAQFEKRDQATAYTPTTDQQVSNYIPVLETAASNVARFDHNPTTFESLGLMVEQQSTNLFLQSDNLTSFSITPATGLTSVLDSNVAPNGTLTARLLTNTTTTEAHRLFQGVTLGSTAVHTYTVYFKQYTTPWVQLVFFKGTATSAFANFDLSTGALGTVGGGGTATITSVGNGWYRCSLTATPDGTNCNFQVFVLEANSAAVAPTTTGTGKGLFAWGAQFETGAFATSYIATVASQVTRAADSANMTGTNFSSWYNQAEGSVYAEFNYSGSTGLTVEFYQTTSVSNRWYIVANNGSNRAQFVMRPLGSVQADISDAGVNNPPNTMTKIAGAYKVNDFAFSQNGRAAGTDTSGYVTNDLNQLVFGNTSAGNVPLNGRIKKLAYYPKALTATQIQALTS